LSSPSFFTLEGAVLAFESGLRLRALAAVAAATLYFAPAQAQVQAPTLVEEDLPEEEARDKRAARVEEPVPEPQPEPRPATAAPAPSAAPSSSAAGAGFPSPPAAVGAMPGVTISSEELKKLQRPIDPVRVEPNRLAQLWQKRRTAGREQDPTRAEAAGREIRETMLELGIESLPWLAVAEVREAERSLQARAVDEALDHAQLACELAPDIPEVYLALARARLARDPARPLPALSALGSGITAAVREPHTVRSFVGDLAGAVLAALFVAAAATIALLFFSRLRLFLHDFHHLPVVRSGTTVQATVLALVLVSLPILFRLGPLALLLTAVLAMWLYLSTAERITVTVALLAVVALPYLVEGAARATAWQGTLADDVYELEHGDASPSRAASLKARAQGEGLPAAALQALGRFHKRRGELPEARRFYEAAAASDPRAGEVQVNLGNVLFLQGDLEGAKAAYLSAIDRGGSMSSLAAAHYNLSKLYLRLAAVEQSTEARKKAQQEDPAYLAQRGSDDDFRANRWLVDVTLPVDRIAELVARDPAPAAVGEAVRRRVAGPLERASWPWLPFTFIALLWGSLAVAGWLEPSRACERCGRPACHRCDGVSAATCGQCVNVFNRQNVVDTRDRMRKEAQVRRHVQWGRLASRVLAIVGGGAGHIVSGQAPLGAFLLFCLVFLGFVIRFWQGVLPAPQHSPYSAAVRLTLAVPLFVTLYALTVRDAFRRTRED
jgi:tetratricopeptide (TPR) repeat protein